MKTVVGPAFLAAISLFILDAQTPSFAQENESKQPPACNDSMFRAHISNWTATHPKYRGHPLIVGVDSMEQRPERISTPLVDYPDIARDNAYDAKVLLEAVIEADGKPSLIEALQVTATKDPSLPVKAYDTPRAGDRGPTSILGTRSQTVEGWPSGATPPPTTASVQAAFQRAAINGTRQSRFKPAIRDGKAVASVICFPVSFTIRR
jgi:hypothetical protein